MAEPEDMDAFTALFRSAFVLERHRECCDRAELELELELGLASG